MICMRTKFQNRVPIRQISTFQESINGDLLADEAPHVIGGVKAFKYCKFSLLSRNVVEGYCKEVFLFLCCKSSSILEGSKPTHWFCEKSIWQDLQWTRFFTTHLHTEHHTCLSNKAMYFHIEKSNQHLFFLGSKDALSMVLLSFCH